jgi:beta-carotene 3-hydroxylase
MNTAASIAIVIATVAAMEAVANLSHRYIMHGWGWGWHESHHLPRRGRFEKNDLYALVFAIPSIVLIYLGDAYHNPLLWVGTGMTVYGFLYFCAHDGLVHNRWPFRLTPKGRYLKRLVQAHRMHHVVHGREGCVSFGFLYAPPVRRLKEELKAIHGGDLDDGAAIPEIDGPVAR